MASSQNPATGTAGTQPRPALTQGGGQMSSPTKEVNHATLCRFGQETVHDILQKTQELFTLLKAASMLPNGTTAPGQQLHGSTITAQQCQDRKVKVEEHMSALAIQFKKLHMVYDTVQENTSSLEHRRVEELLPVEEDGVVKGERPKVTEAAKYASEEHKEIIEQIRMKNRQLKEIIDQQRKIIWEINTMLSTIKS